MLKTCVSVLAVIILVISVYSPRRHARHYDYVTTDDIYNFLDLRNGNFKGFDLRACNYKDIILYNEDVEINSISKSRNFTKPLAGGEFIPHNCYPLTKTAVIVPYKQRAQQLEIFLKYMHPFLQNQRLHYRIFIVDQNDTLPFNRAKMLNYGAKLAIDYNFDCLILHDVDLIPLNTGNIYACSKLPRHMSSSLDTFRYNLPYLTLFGGVVAIRSKHFQEVNGMSNQFYGWGGEDDDFYRRLSAADLTPLRFSPEISRYTMLFHYKEKANENRYEILAKTKDEQEMDGLRTLSNKYTIILENLYTHVLAS